ncbi:MAG: RNA methyltransferase [Bacteroidales bacterium]|nr:RNA methyltransferase [Bacteroidales bacterium]
MQPELITSAQNPKIKRLLALQRDSSLRRQEGLFVVEGQRELERCLASGFEIDTVFICNDLFQVECFPRKTVAARGHMNGRGPQAQRSGRDERSEVFRGKYSNLKTIEVSKAVYEKIAYRGGTEGVVAEVRVKERKLEELELPQKPLVVVLESVEKPGNLGAVLRSADAAGADAVIVCDPLTDLWNPNLIRASVGAVFALPAVACSSAEAIAFLKSRGIRILTAQLQDSELYYDTDMKAGTALVMGTESTGLSEQWREAADAHIRIPMLGIADSLNVSVSAAILLFEAVRQRQGGI